MFARCTQLFTFSAVLIAISGSLALAQNFPGPQQGPQIVTPQGDPPSLLNQQNGQFNGQYAQQNNGPAPADRTPRLNPQYGQQQFAQPQFQRQPFGDQQFAQQPYGQQQFAGPPQNSSPQRFQRRGQGNWGHSHDGHSHGQHQHHGQCAGGCSHSLDTHAPLASANYFSPPPMPTGFQCQGGDCQHGGF